MAGPVAIGTVERSATNYDGRVLPRSAQDLFLNGQLNS